MSEFKVGDYVQVVEMRGEGAEDYHERRADYLGMVGRITDISGADYPYSVDFGSEVSYHWFNADELTAIAPATEPPAAAQGEGESWGVNPTERELVAYGDGYASGLMDGPEYAPLKNEIIALQAALQQAQRERDAALATLKPFAVFGTEFIRIRVNGDDPMHSDRVTHALNDVEITVGDWQAAASAQQAANAEGGA